MDGCTTGLFSSKAMMIFKNHRDNSKPMDLCVGLRPGNNAALEEGAQQVA